MPVNKNALLRYKIIDRCLRNRYRRWTIEDLVDEVSEALYDMEGIRKGISLRTIQFTTLAPASETGNNIFHPCATDSPENSYLCNGK